MEKPAKSAGRARDVDMTTGSILRHLIRFALPLLIGNIFQQLYNTVDTWVVGNYVGNEAFSAVGSVTPIINMLIGLFVGLSSGAGVVISHYYGAKHYERVKDTVHTSLIMTAVLTVIFSIVGILMAPAMLHLMKTPENVFPQSSLYLRIYFGGIVGLLFYNMGASIMRAVGNSRRPFYYLVVSALINTVLDLLFVLRFHMGVEGVALATIIAQAISAALTIIYLLRTDSCVRLSWRALKCHWPILRRIVQVGIPAGIQMAITSFSNVFVQSYINQFGSNAMGGWTVYNKMEQFAFLPIQSIALAVTTFVGQNLGIAQVDRAKRGTRDALIMSFCVHAVIGLSLTIFAPYIVTFFNSDPNVKGYGVLFLRHLLPLQIVCCINQIYSAALRGAGNAQAPMIIMLSTFVVFRQIYLFVMSHFIANEILPLAMGYPAGWLLCSLLTILYYRRVHLTTNRLVMADEEDASAAV